MKSIAITAFLILAVVLLMGCAATSEGGQVAGGFEAATRYFAEHGSFTPPRKPSCPSGIKLKEEIKTRWVIGVLSGELLPSDEACEEYAKTLGIFVPKEE